jgi:hypothetical protein
MGPKTVQAVRIDYPKRWFVVGTAIVVPSMAAMLVLAVDTIETFGRTFWFACAFGICVPLLLLLVPPIFTYHYAGEKGLKLRMGLLMNSTVPYRYIRDIRDHSLRFGGLLIGVGVRYIGGKKTVYVTSSFDDLIEIRFHGPQKLGTFLRPMVDTVVMNVVDKEGFMAIVMDKAGLQEH